MRRSALLYAALCFLAFLPLPLHGQLPGNTDTLLAIALSNAFVEKIGLILHGLGTATSLYPAGAVYAYGENCAGLGFLFMFLRAITGSDIWGYYLFISTLFTLNSFAVFRFTTLFVRDRRAAFLAGLAFSFAAFTLANVDDPNVIFVFFPVTAWYFLEKGVRESKKSLLITSALLSGLQIWFGLYVFVFQALFLTLFLLSSRRKLREILNRRDLRSAALAFFAPVLPLFGLYVYNASFRNVYSPYDNSYIVRAASLSWQYFWNVLPGNLMYSTARNLHRGGNLDSAGWYTLRKTCFVGFLFPALACAGFIRQFRKTGLYLVILVLFLALSFGTGLPGFRLLLRVPFGGYFRVPLRFFLFALVPLCLYFAAGAEALLGLLASRPRAFGTAAAALLALVFIAENVPFPLPGYDYASAMRPPEAYAKFFAGMSARQIVLDLPSTFRARLPDWARIWTYNREALYMNWQTYHRQIIVGGVNGYVPVSRMETQKAIDRLPADDAFDALKSIGVGYVVFHKGLVLIPAEDILTQLKRSARLKLALEDGDTAIFRVL